MKINHIIIGLMTVALLGTAVVSFAGMHGGMGSGSGMMMGQSMNGGHGGHIGKTGMGHGKMNGGVMGVGHDKMHGGKGFMQNLTPEQQEKSGALREEFIKKTEPLRANI